MGRRSWRGEEQGRRGGKVGGGEVGGGGGICSMKTEAQLRAKQHVGNFICTAVYATEIINLCFLSNNSFKDFHAAGSGVHTVLA